MFANTITITIATGQDRILNRVNQDNFGSEYQYSDANEAISMKIRHSTDSVDSDNLTMKRHNVFFVRIVYPTTTTLLKKFSYTATLRHDKFSDPAVVAGIAKGVNAWLATGTNVTDLAAGAN